MDVKRNITDKSSIGSINTNIEIMTNQSNSSYTNNTVKSSNTRISTSLADNLNCKVLNQNHNNIIANNMERSPNLYKEYSNNMPKKQINYNNNYSIQKNH